MSEFVHYEVRDRVAVLTIDNPPVNALGPGVWEAVAAAVARASADTGADAAVLIGAGSTFVAGADINAFRLLRTREDSLDRSAGNHTLLSALEDAPKPLLAAIHGNALGGGLELAMACHFRVAAKDAKVGQPEVNLGIIPGAGGTQRLPRLAGAALAIEMCTGGKPVPAARAHAAGIVDQVATGDLLTEAIAFAAGRARAGERPRTRAIAFDAEARTAGLAACAQARASFLAGPPAPRAAVDAIEAALTMDFDAGSVRERELFADCVVSTESKALRHLFFAEREAAKVADVPRDTPTLDLRRAAVIGAGTMGGGIAMSYASAGIPVLLKETDDAALQRGLAVIRKNYESAVAKGRLSAEQLEQTMALFTLTTSYDGFDAVDVVVEAVFEDMDLKKKTFAELGRVTRPDCVLASNTSTLDIDEFAQASGRPAQVIGHHFFSPANVMKLLEIVRGRATSASVIATSVKLGKRLGKVPVVVGNCFGFVANRMLAYYMREAYLLLEEGASVEQIDRVLTTFGLPVGPFGMQDIAGIDVGARIRQYLASVGKTRAEGPQSEVPDRLYEMGRYGQKTGAGWYRYEAGKRDRIPDPLVEQIAAEAAAKRGLTRRAVSDDEILARITTALANEGARVLEDGFAQRAGDIDVIYCYGFGFPRHRGGPMFYADTVGLPTVLARVHEYRARFGDYWQPAPLLERLVAEGRGFHGGRRLMAYRNQGAITVGRWLAFLFFVALTCAPIGHMAWFWFVEQERGRQSESWPTADGVFERNGVRGASDSSRHAAYRYTFDGKTYQGFREGFAYKDGPPGTVGAAIKVYVNPADPSMSVLYPGESDKRWPLGVGTGLTLFLALFAFSRWPVVSRVHSTRQTSWLPFIVTSLVMLGAWWIMGLWAMELHRGRASESWPSVAGVLVQPGGKQTGTVYRYEVGGSAYRGERVRFAWSRKHDYGKDEEIRVFVNPADPTDAVLHPGPNWSPWIPLFVSAWIAISTLLVWASWPPWGRERPRESS